MNVRLMIAHSQVTEHVVLLVSRVTALLDEALQSRVLITISGLTRGRARTRLRPLQALKVILELVMKRHVLGGTARVRSRCRGDLVIDRLEVPGQALQPHGRSRLERSRIGTIVFRDGITQYKLGVTVACLDCWRLYFLFLRVFG